MHDPRRPSALLLTALLAATTWGSCGRLSIGPNGGRAVRGSGRPAERILELPPFHAVRTEGGLDLALLVGRRAPARLRTDDNLLDRVEVAVRDGVLSIRPREPIAPEVGLVFEAGVPTLDSVEGRGAARVTLHDVRGDRLRLHFEGAASVRADGKVGHLDLSCKGAVSADLGGLEAETATVSASGAGTVEIRTSGLLRVRATGAARIVQHGAGPIEEETLGLAVVTRTSGD